MFSKLKTRLDESIKSISESIKKKEIREKDLSENLKEFEMNLIRSDIGFETSKFVTEKLKKELVGKEVERGKIQEKLKRKLKECLVSTLKTEDYNLLEKIKEKEGPFLILFLGFNGVGKTLSISKVCKVLMNSGFTCVLAAGDTFRAASIEQLEELGEDLGVKVIRHDYGSDPAAVVYDSIEYARANAIDVILADTAGRSHKDVNLMEQLKKICRVNEVDSKILVIDSLTGNDSIEQAREFENSVGVNGVILTKMDINEKGGAAFSVSHAIKRPILWIGTGQNYDDLKEFQPEKLVEEIIG